MLKKLFFKQQGFTLVELMVVVVITAIITVTTITYIRGDIRDDLDTASDDLMSAIRYTRNLAVTRAKYDFANTPGDTSDDIYPDNGYGIIINSATRYYIFADRAAPGLDSPGELMGNVINLTDMAIGDYNTDGSVQYPYFTFKSENELSTNFLANSVGQYQIAIDYNPAYPEDGYNSIITLGENVEDGSIWVALGRVTEGYSTIAPPPACIPTNGSGCSSVPAPCCTLSDNCIGDLCKGEIQQIIK